MKYWWYYLLTYLPFGKRKAPALGGRTQGGYGRVNYWAVSKAELRKDLARCKAEGVTCYHIEYAGWAKTNALVTGGTEGTRKMYKWLLKRCRALGLWLFVSVVNDNMGSRKYGDGGTHLSAVYAKAVAELKFIKGCGMANVIVQPVAETQTDAGRRFDNEAKSLLAGWPLCYNGTGGRPTTTNGMTYRAVHPASIANAAKDKGAIVSSDHGLIIRELSADNSLDGPGNPAKLQLLVANAQKAGAPLVAYYAFQREKHDRRAIVAIGKAI